MMTPPSILLLGVLYTFKGEERAVETTFYNFLKFPKCFHILRSAESAHNTILDICMYVCMLLECVKRSFLKQNIHDDRKWERERG